MKPAAPVTRSRIAARLRPSNSRYSSSLVRERTRDMRAGRRASAEERARRRARCAGSRARDGARGARAPRSRSAARGSPAPPPRRSPRRSSAHVQSPAAATCQIPRGRSSSTSWRTPSARCPTKVGQPRWSSTTATSSRSAPSRSIVRTKLWPVGPKSHELRTIQASGPAAASPCSLLRPYAESGLAPSDSTYGSSLRPSKT